MKVLNDNLIGKVLGTCRLEALIGQGGMSAVFLAQQPHLSRHVAVKVLLPEVVMDSSLHEEFLIRFQREASVVAGLEHVNIMPIYDYGEEEGIAYLVMPYLPRGTLRDILAQRRVLSLQEALIYIEQAASALDYAHAHGIIHRDLKPSNFLLHADGRLVLADFGIARMMQANRNAIGTPLTATGILLGTPEYMAPEMARGEEVDVRADIYELGIILFQMLSGEVPFKGNTPYAILLKHLQEAVPLLHPTHPAISPRVDAVIQKATAKKREERFASAGELAQALHEVATPSSLIVNEHYSPTLPSLNASTSDWYKTVSTNSSPTLNRLEANPTASHGAPRPVPESPKRLKPGIIIVSIVSLIVISAILIGLLTPTIFSPPKQKAVQPFRPLLKSSATPTQKARVVVQQYYNDINSWNYPAAYKLLQTDSSPKSYCSFVNGFAYTEHDDITYGNVTPLGDGTFRVAYTITATEEFPKGTVRTTYEGYQLVEQGTWLIVGGQQNKTFRTPTPQPPSTSTPDTTEQAKTVVKQFYDNINARNYPEAYNLWSSTIQKPDSYCGFVLKYSQMQHDDVSFDNVIQLRDGTVQVPTTINATVETGSETVPSTYHEAYLVGQEDGIWKIMSEEAS